MPTIVIHGIGNHDPASFRSFYFHVRGQLRDSLEQRGAHSPPEAAFFPVYWGSWGPEAWYQGLSLLTRAAEEAAPLEGLRLAAGLQAKSLAAPAVFDPGLAALQIVLSTPGPLHEVLDDLGIGGRIREGGGWRHRAVRLGCATGQGHRGDQGEHGPLEDRMPCVKCHGLRCHSVGITLAVAVLSLA